MFKVIFTYDETGGKWLASVEGAESKQEARDGFHAVILTARQLNTELLNMTIVNDDWTITPVAY